MTKRQRPMSDLQKAAKRFAEDVLEYYDGEDPDDLTQVFMRGYFAGWSEWNVYELAQQLLENQENHPLKMDAVLLKDPVAPEKEKGFFSRFSNLEGENKVFPPRPEPI